LSYTSINIKNRITNLSNLFVESNNTSFPTMMSQTKTLCSVDTNSFMFIFLRVGYVDRLCEKAYKETIKGSVGLKEGKNNLYEFLATSRNYFTDEGYHLIAIGPAFWSDKPISSKWDECEVYDELLFNVIKKADIDPTECVIVTNILNDNGREVPERTLGPDEMFETKGSDNEDEDDEGPFIDERKQAFVAEGEPLGLGEAMECVKRLSELAHCGCLGPYPCGMNIYEYEKMDILMLKFDTESG
jgi:hypothetical protein